jgi:hypothetical protein
LKQQYVYSHRTAIGGLRVHLEANHRDEYLEVCEKNNWPMMLPKERLARAALAESNLNPVVERPRPAFNRESFLAALMRFIVTDDQVSTLPLVNHTWLIIFDFESINIIECPEFRDLLLLLREELKDTDIPHRRKIHDVIINASVEYFEYLKKDLKVRPFPLSVPLY